MKRLKYRYLLLSTAAITMGCTFSLSTLHAASDDRQIKPADMRKVEKKAASKEIQAKNEPLFPADAAGAYLASRYARAKGDIETAAEYLERSVERDPSNMEMSMHLQGLLLLAGKIESAADLASHMQKQGVKDPLADLLVSLRDIRKGKWASAAAELKRSEDGGNIQLWVPLLRGWVDQASGELKKPLSEDSYKVKSGNASALVNYHLALINAKAGYVPQAAKLFEASIEDPKKPPLRIMTRFAMFYEKNKPKTGMDKLLQAFIESDVYKRQLTEISSIQTPREGVAEVLYTMGSIMYGAGIINDTVIYLQLAHYMAPDQADILLGLGDAYTSLKQYELANRYYGKIPSDHALYSRAQIHVAVHEDRIGHTKTAINRLNRLSKDRPKSADALITKGDIFRMHNECNAAIASYSKALVRMKKLVATDWPIFFARGACLDKIGQWDKAKIDFQTALRLYPNQPDVLNYLGYVELERGENLKEAYELIARAIAARPDDAQIIDSMGWLLYQQGQYDQALKYVERATELLPSDPTVNDHLGDVFWQLDRKTEARFQWERALTFSPKKDVEEAIRKKLKNGISHTPLPISKDAHAEVLTLPAAKQKPHP